MPTQEKIKPVIGRIGGKARLASWIGEFIKKHQFSIYCEPFAGSAAIYFWLINENIPQLIKNRGQLFRAVLNDADREIMNLYKTVRDYPELLAYAVYFTPYSRAEHKESQSRGTGDQLEDARKYLTNGWLSAVQQHGNIWSFDKNELKTKKQGFDQMPQWQKISSRILTAAPHLGTSETLDPYACLNDVGRQFVKPDVDFRVEWVRRYLVHNNQGVSNAETGWSFDMTQDIGTTKQQRYTSLPSRILTASPHLQSTLDDLKKVYLECDDAIKVIERWATPETLFYLDPPYVNCENYYAYNAKQSKEDNLKLHYDLANIINSVECAGAIVSYYPNDLLDDLYPVENWDRHYKETVASSAGITRNSKTKTRPKRTELLLVRKQNRPITVNVSGQLSLF